MNTKLAKQKPALTVENLIKIISTDTLMSIMGDLEGQDCEWFNANVVDYKNVVLAEGGRRWKAEGRGPFDDQPMDSDRDCEYHFLQCCETNWGNDLPDVRSAVGIRFTYLKLLDTFPLDNIDEIGPFEDESEPVKTIAKLLATDNQQRLNELKDPTRQQFSELAESVKDQRDVILRRTDMFLRNAQYVLNLVGKKLDIIDLQREELAALTV